MSGIYGLADYEHCSIGLKESLKPYSRSSPPPVEALLQCA